MIENCIFGKHAVKAALSINPERVVRLIVTADPRKKPEYSEIVTLANKAGISIEYWSANKMDKLVTGKHQGLIAQVILPKMREEHELDDILSNSPCPLIIILDGIQDPHNLGACLRTADAAGADCIIIPKDKNVGLTPTVCKIAVGAAETVPVVAVTNLARAIRQLKDKGIWIYGTAGEASQSVYDGDYRGAIAWVLGAEGDGMRRLTRELCDVLVSIPMKGTVGSLNVSCANAIVVYETLRQRIAKR